MKPRSLVIIFLITTIFISCHRKKLLFNPPDSRQLHSIEIADGDEADLLQQQLHLEVKHIQGNKLFYFVQNKEQEQQLLSVGYKINEENPMQVYHKLVQLNYKEKIPDKNQEGEIKKSGIEIINKEKKYWIVRGTLEQLNEIQESGYELKILASEPRPREVEIIVPGPADIQKVNETGIDIFSCEKNKNEELVIYGSAFDFQVENIQNMGYKVIRKI